MTAVRNLKYEIPIIEKRIKKLSLTIKEMEKEKFSNIIIEKYKNQLRKLRRKKLEQTHLFKRYIKKCCRCLKETDHKIYKLSRCRGVKMMCLRCGRKFNRWIDTKNLQEVNKLNLNIN